MWVLPAADQLTAPKHQIRYTPGWLTADTFVEGSDNQLTAQACKATAACRGGPANQ